MLLRGRRRMVGVVVACCALQASLVHAAPVPATSTFLDVRDCFRSGGIACVTAGLGVLPGGDGASIALDLLTYPREPGTRVAIHVYLWQRMDYWIDCAKVNLPYPGWKRAGQYE